MNENTTTNADSGSSIGRREVLAAGAGIAAARLLGRSAAASRQIDAVEIGPGAYPIQA